MWTSPPAGPVLEENHCRLMLLPRRRVKAGGVDRALLLPRGQWTDSVNYKYNRLTVTYNARCQYEPADSICYRLSWLSVHRWRHWYRYCCRRPFSLDLSNSQTDNRSTFVRPVNAPFRIHYSVTYTCPFVFVIRYVYCTYIVCSVNVIFQQSEVIRPPPHSKSWQRCPIRPDLDSTILRLANVRKYH